MSSIGGKKFGFKQTLEKLIPATAGGSDADFVVGVAPVDGVIESVKFYPVSTITGANTNTRKHTLTNKKADNTGTAKPAELQYNSGVNATANIAKTITPSATAADLNVLKGDVLVLTSLHVGTGLADPGGLLVVKFSRALQPSA